jgi:hypothetical protein
MAGVLLKAGTAYPSRAHGFTPVFGGIRVTIFLLFCVVLNNKYVRENKTLIAKTATRTILPIHDWVK